MIHEMPRLKVIDITKIYPHPKNPAIKTPVLAGINFELHPSELAYLVGSSGSGKTTLLDILAGELYFDAGEVILNNRSLHLMNLKQRYQYLRNVKKIIQIPRLNLDFELSLTNNLRLPMVLHGNFGLEEQKARVIEMIKRLNLEKVIETPLKNLSGGELQRLAIGVSTIVPPNLLLLDEPTSQIDSENSIQIRNLIIELVALNESIAIFSTHNETLIKNGRTLRLIKGKLVEE